MADYKCEDKSKYGLDKPYSTITVDYQEKVETSDDNAETSDSETPDSAETTEMVDKQLTILVGNEADDSNRYVMVNDSNEVYTMSEETLSALTDKTEEDFCRNFERNSYASEILVRCRIGLSCFEP